MRFQPKSKHRRTPAAVSGLLLLSFLSSFPAITGCGTPGAPQPPSLELPQHVADLSAVRAGSTVTLHWTMPSKTTDRLLIKTPIQAAICRREGRAACDPAGSIAFAPGADAEFRDSLPPALREGEARTLSYFVELKNKRGRPAELSNPAVVLAGAAPEAIIGLSAEVRDDGVALRWTAPQSNPGQTTAVRLHRRLIVPDAPKQPAKPPVKSGQSLMPSTPEPLTRDLLVGAPAAANGALDTSIHFGETYEYTAQRVLQITLEGQALELAGENSAPVRVEAIDTFPPAVPQELAAVLVPEDKAVDLSWQPDTEPDLAGYIVYRAEAGNTDWKPISGPQPIPVPAWRDNAVDPAHGYRYAVSAIDLAGHESRRSKEANVEPDKPSPNPQ